MLSNDTITLTFSTIKTTSTKITIDIGKKISPHKEQTHKRDNKPNTMKKNSVPKKQKQIFHKTSKYIINDYITGKGFRMIKRIKNCFPYLNNIQIR